MKSMNSNAPKSHPKTEFLGDLEQIPHSKTYHNGASHSDTCRAFSSWAVRLCHPTHPHHGFGPMSLWVSPSFTAIKVACNPTDLYLKVNPPSLKVNPPSLQVNPPSLKVNPPSLKVNPPSLKVNPPSLKVNPPSLKVNPPSLKVNPPSLKVNPPTEGPNSNQNSRVVWVRLVFIGCIIISSW